MTKQQIEDMLFYDLDEVIDAEQIEEGRENE